MPPTLDAPIMDLQAPTSLPAAPAHPPAAPQSDGHDHPLRAEADIDHRCAGQAQKPVGGVEPGRGVGLSIDPFPRPAPRIG